MESEILLIKKQFGDQLHNMICKKVGHDDHCHDIMQEVYLKIMLNLPKISRATNMAAYLVTIANNTVTDHYRKPGQVTEAELSDNCIGLEEEQQKDRAFQLTDCCLRPMIESLPAIYRDALIFTELEGMKHRDYAEVAGISLSNAKMRVQRAKAELKEVIMQCCNYEFDSYGNILDCTKNNPNACCKK
jgi:RNA polymerase sigma-70 factor (ECF subfamily)